MPGILISLNKKELSVFPSNDKVNETFIFFMIKETTIESTTSIKMSEATTTDAESKLNYDF